MACGTKGGGCGTKKPAAKKAEETKKEKKTNFPM
jgi:hypothetical protein